MAGCNYVRVDDTEWGEMGWGIIWREENYHEDELSSRWIQCTAFDTSQRDSFDGIWKFGMACAYIAIITVSISSIAALALACATYSKRWKDVLSVCFAVGAICQVLTFVVMASNRCDAARQDCTLSFGAGITVGGITCSLLAAATIYALVPPSHVRKAAVGHPVAVSGREEDRENKRADSETEDDTHGAAADPEAGVALDTDDVDEEEGVFVQEEGKGKEEEEEAQDLNPPAAAEDEERNPFAEMTPVVDTNDENFSDAPLAEEDVEAIIDEGRDVSGVEYDKAEAFGKK